MYKAQFKAKTPYESWTTLGTYGSESVAISMALSKKKKGALLVRVVNSKGLVIYSN